MFGCALSLGGTTAEHPTRCDPDSVDGVDEIEETDTAGSSGLSYDPEDDQYTYVWKTKKEWSGTCRQLIVKLGDGSDPHRAYFEFK